MNNPDFLDQACAETPEVQNAIDMFSSGKFLGTALCVPGVAFLLFQACTRDEALATIQANPDFTPPISAPALDEDLEDGGDQTDSGTPDIGISPTE
jgi:hypothetical protein